MFDVDPAEAPRPGAGSAAGADVLDEPSDLVAALDAANVEVARAQRRFLELVNRAGATELWRADGARDLAHWLSMRYGISAWKARRWIGAASVLGELPSVEHAFTSGELGLDKTVELARFATPEREVRLADWARDVSVATVRRRADREVATDATEIVADERARRLEVWWIEEGRRLGLAGELPAAAGAVVVKALGRAAERIGEMPGEDGPVWADARRADALVAVCSASIATDPDADRATVVLHARVDTAGMLAGAELEGATAVPRSVAERLVCDARVQVLAEDGDGTVVRAGAIRRHPPAWVARQLRYRDRGCRFPGCGTNAFTQAHHVRWFSRGGSSDLDNLVLVCSFHHRLVHEHGWAIRLEGPEVTWITPDGERYRAGPRAPTRA